MCGGSHAIPGPSSCEWHGLVHKGKVVALVQICMLTCIHLHSMGVGAYPHWGAVGGGGCT